MKKKQKFEVDNIWFQFDCKFGVYRGQRSLCYCTDKIRAKLIAYALNKLTLKQIKRLLKRFLKEQENE